MSCDSPFRRRVRRLQSAALDPPRARLRAASLLVGAVLMLGACARPADQIGPANNSQAFPEAGIGCDALSHRKARLAEQLLFASIEQNQVAREDRERLFGLVPSMFGTLFRGDVSKRVAALKADINDVDSRLIAFGCAAPRG